MKDQHAPFTEVFYLGTINLIVNFLEDYFGAAWRFYSVIAPFLQVVDFIGRLYRQVDLQDGGIRFRISGWKIIPDAVFVFEKKIKSFIGITPAERFLYLNSTVDYVQGLMLLINLTSFSNDGQAVISYLAENFTGITSDYFREKIFPLTIKPWRVSGNIQYQVGVGSVPVHYSRLWHLLSAHKGCVECFHDFQRQ